MDRQLIEQYASGGEKLSLAIRGLTREDLLCPPDPDWNAGKWSIQQIVMHVADCEGVFADRIKRVIAEDDPPLAAFDESKWAAALRYDAQSSEDAVKLVELTQKQLASLLRQLPDSAFARSGTHSEAGKQTLEQLLSKAVSHLEHHVSFIHKKRAKNGQRDVVRKSWLLRIKSA